MQTSENTAEIAHETSPATYQTLAQAKFYASDRCQIARSMLQELSESADHDTTSSRDTDELSFCERHLEYLSKFPHIEVAGYMSNLRLMTRKRSNYKG
jgi:hypothetical protein